MQYSSFIVRNEPDEYYHFEDEPESVKVKAYTYGCSCCSAIKTLDRADLERELQAVEERAGMIRRMLAAYF